jgi:EAL domain-containing protein (putative c-di-GMP-specific phosphodiesterase class I)
MLQHPALVDDVAGVLEETGLPPSCLRLEITEGTLVQDGPAAAVVMSRLKRLGVRLAMDDFGTGYSSLSTLQSYPFDILKIDQSFVRALGQGAENVAIVQAIIDLATSLNLTVTGEGIETREQLELLQSLGSHHGQGYLFSRPCPADEMDRYMADHAAALVRRTARAIEPAAAV